MLGGNIVFFFGDRLQIEQLPGIFLVLFIESPILPTDGNQMSTDGIARLVVKPEQILVGASFFSPRK
jgi:hypothetical protein